jgi:hypothetical protein
MGSDSHDLVDAFASTCAHTSTMDTVFAPNMSKAGSQAVPVQAMQESRCLMKPSTHDSHISPW